MGVRGDGILQVDDVGGGGGAVNVDITNPIGQDTMVNSVSVAIASDQSAIPTSPAVGNVSVNILTVADIATLDVSNLGAVVIQRVDGVAFGILLVEATVDGANWLSIIGSWFYDTDKVYYPVTYAPPGLTIVNVTGYTQIRVRPDPTGWIGDTTVTIHGLAVSRPDTLNQVQLVGVDNLDGSTLLIVESSSAAPTSTAKGVVTRPVGFPDAQIPSDNIANGYLLTKILTYGLVFDGATWDRMRGDATNGLLVNLGANNDVSITGAVAQGTPAALANAWPVKLTDGTNEPKVLAASTAPAYTDKSLVVTSREMTTRDSIESDEPLYLPVAGRTYNSTAANAKAKPIPMIIHSDTAGFYLDNYPSLFNRSVAYLRQSDGAIVPQTNEATTVLFGTTPGIVTHVLNEQKTASAILNSLGASIIIVISDYPVDSVMFSLDGAASGFSGTLKAFINVDGFDAPCDLWDLYNHSWIDGSNIDINGKYRILLAPTAGASRVRLEVTAYTSGAITAKARGGPGAVNFPWIVKSKTTSFTAPSIGTSSGTILAANSMRLGAIIQNEGSAICYVKFGATASLTSYSIQLAVGAYYELKKEEYVGVIDGITSAGTAQLRVTEFTGY